MSAELPETDALRDYELEAAHPEPHPRLLWSDAGGEREVTVQARALLGSAADATIVVADRAVSRLHAELEPAPEGVWVRDVGSRNGTFVQGVRVTRALLPEGGALRVGSTTMRVRYGAAAAASSLWQQAHFGPLLGRSAVMRKLFAAMGSVAPTASSVLVQGETGTGKELVAEAVHGDSPRSSGPFVVVDCAALPESLLESELFGHAKGAFTGATEARGGAFEAADGGTLFLDEIGELPLAMQPKLLRALESRTVRRLGETTPRKVDLRVICATHRDLIWMVNNGAFREDLYFRLAVLPLFVPPLRERPNDIPLLLDAFLRGRARALIDPERMHELQALPWLGNVRELRNFAERVEALGVHEAMQLPDAGAGRRAAEAATTTTARLPSASGSSAAGEGRTTLEPSTYTVPFREFREALLTHGEKEYFSRLMARHGGNVQAAAAEAGLDRTYLYRLLRKHGL